MKDKRFDVPGMNIINCRDRGLPSLHKEGNSQKLQQFWGPTQEWPPFERAGGESSSRRHSDEDSRPLASPAENEESSLHTAGVGTAVRFASYTDHLTAPVSGASLPLTPQLADTSGRIAPVSVDMVQMTPGIYLIHFLITGTLPEAGYMEITPVIDDAAQSAYAARFTAAYPGERGCVSGSFPVTGASPVRLSLRMESSSAPADSDVHVMILQLAE